ncbi:MAG: acyltransferase family protein [Negativibacillus sp.]|nr:acyltransferase family protein [Negativibacillus sp.]
MNQTSFSRQLHYDLLRIFASFMVVMLHVSAFYWDKIQTQTAQWMALNLFDSAVRSCVPLFFMLSGAFLLAKELPLNKLLGKNVLHLAVVWLVWSVLYAVDAIGLPAFFHADAGRIFTAVVNGKYHLWFLPKMIEVYLMVPLLYAGTKMKEGKGLYYLLVLFGLFGILKSTLTVFVYPNPSIQVLLKTRLPNLAFYSGYFLLGYFLEHRWKKKIPSRWLLLTLLAPLLFLPCSDRWTPFRRDSLRAFFMDIFAFRFVWRQYACFYCLKISEQKDCGESGRERLPLFQKLPWESTCFTRLFWNVWIVLESTV